MMQQPGNGRTHQLYKTRQLGWMDCGFCDTKLMFIQATKRH